MTEDDLRRSIGVYNQNRALIRELYAMKRETPRLVSADEAYVLVAVGGLIPREEHNELLEAVLPLIAARPNKKQDKIRLVFEGGFCEQPPLDLIRAIARSCYIVDDDFLIGLRWILADVPLDGDPLVNLAFAYLERPPTAPCSMISANPRRKC